MAVLLGLGAAAGGAASAAGGIGSVIGTIASLGGTILSAGAAKSQADAEAQAAEFNAQAAEQEAAAARQRAAINAEDFRRRESFKRSSALADRAASGVALAGTPLLTDADVFREIQLGASRLGDEGAVRANERDNAAQLSRQKGASAKRAGRLGAGASLLSGLARAF